MEGNKWWQPGLIEVSNLGVACGLAYLLGSYVKPHIN